LGHPVSIGAIILFLGCLAMLLPIWLHIVNTDDIDLQYGDIVSICAFVATVVIAVFSVMPNLHSMAETSRSSHYSELDNMYLHLLTLAVEKPYLRMPETLTPKQRTQYEPYAFMVWNFLETIHDRCAEDRRLRDTWAPVIAAEHAVHRAWFEKETAPYYADGRSPKFCIHFCDFIWRSFWLETGARGPQDAMARNWDYRTDTEIDRDPRIAIWRDPPQPVAASNAA
jgi:hypothetical protein